MQDLLRWLASWKDIPVTPGTELRLSLSGFPSGGLGMLVILGIIAAVALVWVSYRRDASRLSFGRRVLLTTLRTVAVLLTCLLLLTPEIVAVRRELQPGHTIMLVDTSQSMGHTDGFKRPEVADIAAGWRGAKVVDPGNTAKIELVKSLLAQGDQQILRELAERNRVLVYGFSSGLEEIGVLELDRDDLPGGVDVDATEAPKVIDLDKLVANGSYSNLGGAVRQALGKSAAANVAGVVLLTDGRRNLGPQGPEIRRLLNNRGIPAAVVLPVGDPSPTRRLTLTRVEAPEKVFQKDPFTISAVLEGQGYQETDVTVRLKRQAEGSDAIETVREERVNISADSPEASVTFDRLIPDAAGLYTWTVEIDPPEFEAASPERHVQRAQVEVLGEQTRVLFIAGGPSHEYRILRTLLTRDKTIELSCWLLSADPTFPQDGNVSLEELPTERAELEKYDVFIVMDPDSTKLGTTFCEMVAEQVEDNGAGLWWICGEKYTLDAVRPGAPTESLAALLPVELDDYEAGVNVGLRGIRRPWRYVLSPQGRSHKATRIVEEKAASEALWPRLPGFYFAFPVKEPKPAATVLVAHTRPTEADPTGEKPLIATHYVGAGRVLFNATDDIYRWRFAFEAAYDRFWVKGIRYLFEGRLTAGNSRFKLTLSEDKIELGEAVKVTADVRNESFEPLIANGYELAITTEEGTTDTLALQPVEGVPGQFESWLRPTGTGWYRVQPSNAVEGRSVQASFQVVRAQLEKEGPVDLEELAAIAGETGQLVERADQFSDALESIESRTKIESFTNAQAIWDSWATIALLLSVLAAEWWIRKRSNLL